MPREAFEAMVARIVEYVHAGDAFQVVPSPALVGARSPVEPFSIYRGLRAVNPSPYMYFLDFEDFQLVGASPEPLLTVTGRQRHARARSPARARAARPPTRTSAIAAELLADEKERAEHVMLVDLGRNDLGRVCEYGTRRGRDVHGRRDLLARDPHRLQRRRRRCARTSARSTRCAPCSPPARCRARRRCARWRSSTSSSRSSAAPTAARSAGCPTPASSTPASASAPSWSRTASPTCRPAAAPSPTPSPTTSTRSRAPRRAAWCARSSWRRRQAAWP